jgi:hypothetical protein
MKHPDPEGIWITIRQGNFAGFQDPAFLVLAFKASGYF